MQESDTGKQPRSKTAVGEEGFAARVEIAEKQALIRRPLFLPAALGNPFVVVGVLFSAFLAFLIFDYVQLSREANMRLDLTARLIAVELKDATIPAATSSLGNLLSDVPSKYEIYLTEPDGRLAVATGQVGLSSALNIPEMSASKMLARQDIDGQLGEVIIAVEKFVVLTPLLWHAASGFLLLTAIVGMLFLHHQRLKRRFVLMKSARGEDELLAELPVGVARWSTDGKLLEFNSNFKEHLGISKVKAGVTYASAMGPVTQDENCTVVDTDQHHRLLEVWRPDGKTFLVEERALDNDQFITTVFDVTDQRSAEKTIESIRKEQRALAQQLLQEKFKAEAASRAKTSFLAHLSHDVRTPLNHIIGFADLVAHQTYGPVGDKRYLNYINDIKGSGEQLLNSFSEILELAQIEGGHLSLRCERFALVEAIKSTSSRFTENAKRAGLTLDISPAEDVTLYTDRLCLERMLGNIVENAIRFTPAGGSVKLAAWLAEDGIVFEITDTGIGMSQERLADMDQPFVLGDAAFTKDSSGVGLGIAISRAIAELSGGELMIDSSPAVGTTVAISLPAKVVVNKQAPVTQVA